LLRSDNLHHRRSGLHALQRLHLYRHPEAIGRRPKRTPAKRKRTERAHGEMSPIQEFLPGSGMI
jgi:hypothetical protein